MVHDCVPDASHMDEHELEGTAGAPYTGPSYAWHLPNKEKFRADLTIVQKMQTAQICTSTSSVLDKVNVPLIEVASGQGQQIVLSCRNNITLLYPVDP